MADIITQIQQDKANIRDQLGSRPAITPYLVYEFTESIEEDEMPTVIETRDTTGDNLWGIAVWGTGLWQAAKTNSLVVTQVILPNNTFKDYLRDATFVDTTNTTAVVNYTDNSITF